MDKNKKEYRSSVRSKRMIKEAFLKLIQEKNVEKITVTDIVKEADINRSTFYAHYPDVRGVMEAFEDQVIEQMMEVLKDFKYEHFFQNPVPVLLKINRYLEEDLEFYRILITAKGSDSFLEKLKRLFIEYMNSDTDIPESVRHSVTFQMQINFFAGGLINMYKQWFMGNLQGMLNDIPIEVGRIIKMQP